RSEAYFVFPLAQGTPGKQCGLAATGVYQPSLRSPWLAAQARQYMDMGFCLGFGGMLTYERSSKLRTLAAKLPLEHLVLETDAPDMPGAAHQYQRNSPEYLPEVLDVLSEIRSESRQSIAATTTINVCRVLTLPDKTRPVPDPQDA
ncbi:TatD family hydrolase, partial [Thiolapillus sp.]